MNDSLSQSLRSGNSLTSAQANAARLANNKKIVFTDKQEMYKNHNEMHVFSKLPRFSQKKLLNQFKKIYKLII